MGEVLPKHLFPHDQISHILYGFSDQSFDPLEDLKVK